MVGYKYILKYQSLESLDFKINHLCRYISKENINENNYSSAILVKVSYT